MTTTPNSCVLVLMTALVGCAPKQADTESSSSSSSNSSSSSSSSTPSTSSTSTGAGSTTDTPTDEPTTGGTGEQTCAPGPLVGVACEPRGEVQASWEFSFEEGSDGLFEEPFDAMCSVKSVDDDGEIQTIGLLCGDDARVLSLSSQAPHVQAQVAVDDMVHMQLAALYSIEIPNLWFSLRAADERLLVAGLKRAILPLAEPLQIAPLSFAVLATDCETFEEQACWIGQRGAIEVTMDDMTSVVFDGNTASLGLQGSFQILVGDATRILCKSDECEFTAEPWETNALIVWVPEG